MIPGVTVADPPSIIGDPSLLRRSGRVVGASIRDFLTDGSLAALCAELSSITGTRIELRDEADRLIDFDPAAGDRPWVVRPGGEPPPAHARRVPLNVGGRVIGSLVVHAGRGADEASIVHALGYLARAASELCDQELALWRRVKEVELMYRLSALLVRTGGAERVLAEALGSALDVLHLDAGSVVLLPDDSAGARGGDERELVLKASRGLSREWLESPLPLSRERLFERMALAGEVVSVPDLLADERVLIHDRVKTEGLRAFLSAGLIFQGRPMGVIRLYAREPRAFTEAEGLLLRSVAEHAALAVQQARMRRILEEERELQRQLQLAADVQRRMLPAAGLSFPGFDVAARYVPSHRVGGDFYDVFPADQSLALAVGDVAGNGIAAALLMAGVRANLRAYAALGLSVDQVLARVNDAMCRDTLESEFATLWYGQIDRAAGLLRYSSAGHEPPFVVRGGQEVIDLRAGGLVSGVCPGETYEQGEVALHAGDVLVAYTDGLPEAANFARERFGARRVRASVLSALAGNPGARASEIIERVLWDLRQFVGIHAKPDDQTIVVARVLT